MSSQSGWVSLGGLVGSLSGRGDSSEGGKKPSSYSLLDVSAAALKVGETAEEATMLLRTLNTFLSGVSSEHQGKRLREWVVTFVRTYDIEGDDKAALESALGEFRVGGPLQVTSSRLVEILSCIEDLDGELKAKIRAAFKNEEDNDETIFDAVWKLVEERGIEEEEIQEYVERNDVEAIMTLVSTPRLVEEAFKKFCDGTATKKETVETVSKLVPEDEGIREVLEAFEKGTSLMESLQKIQSIVSKYHLIVGGRHMNPTGVEEPPLESHVAAEARLRSLQASSLDLPETDLTSGKTNEKIDETCKQTADLCAMWAVDWLFGRESDENDLRTWIQGNQSKESYLAQFGKFKRFFARIAFSIVHGFLQETLQRTVQRVAADLRKFLKGELEMATFTQDKLEDLSEYYAEIETLRQRFISRRKHEGTPIGTFEEFLEKNLSTFAEKFTEKELYNSFRSILVDMYVPKPNLSLGPVRIPGLTRFAEWCVWKIRKRIVSSYFKRTQLVETLVTKGVSSIQYAQLEMKRLLNFKLSEVYTQLLHEVSAQREGEEASTRVQGVVDDYFLERIQAHSHHLMRFIKIEACRGRERELSLIDNPSLVGVRHILSVIGLERQFPADQIEQAVEDAVTGLTTRSFTYLSANRENEVERQLQLIFDLLDTEFTPFPPDYDPVNAARTIQSDMEAVNADLKKTITALAQLAARDAVDQKLSESMSSEKHNKNKTVAAAEVAQIQALADVVVKGFNPNNPEQVDRDVEAAVAGLQAYINYQSRHDISACYTNVQSEINKAYKSVLDDYVNKEILPALEVIKNANGMIKTASDDFKVALDILGSEDAIRKKAEGLSNSGALLEQIELIEKLQAELADPQAATFRELVEKQEAGQARLGEIETLIEKLQTLEGTSRDDLPEELQALKDCNEDQVEQMIKGTWRDAGLLSTYQKEKAAKEKESVALDKQLTFLRVTFGEETTTAQFDAGQEAKRVEITAAWTEITRLTQEIQRSSQAVIDEERVRIEEARGRIEESAAALKEIKIEVKGCVSAGEMELKAHVGPQLVSHLSTIIKDKVETIVHALGKPFHYKQIVLRLILADVVKRNRA